jgi:hypothetical protein
MISTLLALVLTVGPAELFRVEKSSNQNALVYSVSGDQVVAEWHMADGSREPLTGFEWSFAFGFEQRGREVVPVAKKDWRIVLESAGPVLYGLERPMIVRRVFVKIDWPCSVARIDFFGEDLRGQPIIQSFEPE